MNHFHKISFSFFRQPKCLQRVIPWYIWYDVYVYELISMQTRREYEYVFMKEMGLGFGFGEYNYGKNCFSPFSIFFIYLTIKSKLPFLPSISIKKSFPFDFRFNRPFISQNFIWFFVLCLNFFTFSVPGDRIWRLIC